MNNALLTETTFTDIGYSGDERRYTLVAVDSFDQESTARSVTLPVMRAGLVEGSLIRRGIMNRVEYTVENRSETPVGNVRIKALVNGKIHISETFDLEAKADIAASVVVGGYSDLDDFEPITTTVEILPPTGEKVEIARTSDIKVADGMLVLRILNEEFTRGGAGKVMFTLENTGVEEIEIITAKNSGKSPSNQFRFYLMAEDENILTASSFKQGVGESMVTLSNKNTVARIPVGETFLSDWMTLSVPANAPDRAIIRLSISNIYFHQGKTDQVTMSGLSTTHELSLIETSFYGEVSEIIPAISNGDQDIVTETVTLENKGLAAMHDVRLSLTPQGGRDRSRLDPSRLSRGSRLLGRGGEERDPRLVQPPGIDAGGPIRLLFARSQLQPWRQEYRRVCLRDQSGVGHVLFKASDIYTGTLDNAGDPIQGLSGARVKIRNEQVLTEEYNGVTDSFGETEFNDLPAGRWRYRIRAANHQERTSRFWIKPGVTTNAEVFLHYNLVTVEWEVTETTIEDNYKIVLNAVYETNVPAAVLVVEPASVTLPDMEAGDVFNGEISLTNHGLIRAEKLTPILPPDSARFRYELLGGLPDSIEARERITVPYRVTRLQFPDGEGDASGGGCDVDVDPIGFQGVYECIMGMEVPVGVEYLVMTSISGCSSPGGWTFTDEKNQTDEYNVSVDTPDYMPDPPSNTGEALPGGENDCPECPDDPDCPERKNGNKNKHKEIDVGCSVNTFTGHFHDEALDVSVKVKGGMVAFKRFYNWLN